ASARSWAGPASCPASRSVPSSGRRSPGPRSGPAFARSAPADRVGVSFPPVSLRAGPGRAATEVPGRESGSSRGEQQNVASSVATGVDAPFARVADVAPLARVVTRDADDFVSAAFRAHRDELFTFLARTTRDDDEAEDLVQETFLRLAREARAGRVPDQVRAWLYRVASNL